MTLAPKINSAWKGSRTSFLKDSEVDLVLLDMNSPEYPIWVWILFFATVLTALFVDLVIVNRRTHAPSRRETLVWSSVWISLALLFNAFILWQFGLGDAKLFFTVYLI